MSERLYKMQRTNNKMRCVLQSLSIYTIALCTHDVHLPMQAESNNKVVGCSLIAVRHIAKSGAPHSCGMHACVAEGVLPCKVFIRHSFEMIMHR